MARGVRAPSDAGPPRSGITGAPPRSEAHGGSQRIYEEELSALALWRRDQEERIDADTIGLSAQISFETAAAFEQRRAELDAAYERRVEALRDQSTIELTSIDLIGGLLLVSPAS